MAQLGKLTVDLEANIARFTADMNRASKQTEQAMARMQSAADLTKRALQLVGVGVTFNALVGQVNKSIGALADLDDMAQKTGASVDNLSKLSKVASVTATDWSAVDGVLVKLSKNLAAIDDNGGKVRAALDAIGVSTDGIERRDPAQVFVDVSRKLQGYQDGAAKVALMNDLMGKSAADLIPYMNDVAERFDEFQGDTEEAAAAAAKFQDDMGALRLKFDEWTTSVITAALPAATDFVGALNDMARESKGVTGNSVASWADDTAIGLARAVDIAKLFGKILGAVSGSFKVVAADIKFMGVMAENSNPITSAKKIANGGDPMKDIEDAANERNKILEEANARYDALWNEPVDELERAIRARIAGRHNIDTTSIDAFAGMVGPTVEAPKPLNYAPGEPKDKKKPGKSAAQIALEEEIKAWTEEENRVAEAYRKDRERAVEAENEAIAQNERAVENIRQSMLTQAEVEDEMHAERMAALQQFHDAKAENVAAANAQIEAEVARHEQAKADIAMQTQQSMLFMAQDSAGQLYDLMRQAGMEQTALGKTLFVAQKAMAVAQIIMNTNVAAATALAMPPLGLGPVAGVPLAGMIKAMGYASAGMTAGLAIADASAEGGYDIPAGVNPLTQLHEKEMVLPRAQADVIRGLAVGGGRSNAPQVTYAPQIHIDSRTDQQEVRKLVINAVQQGNADLVDKLQRAGRI